MRHCTRPQVAVLKISTKPGQAEFLVDMTRMKRGDMTMKLISAALITVAITAASSNAAASFCPSGKKSKHHAYYFYPQHHDHYRERRANYPGYPKPYRHAYMPAYKQPKGRKATPVESPKSKAYETSGNIIDTAIDAGSVSSLIDALNASGLSETLSGTDHSLYLHPATRHLPKSLNRSVAHSLLTRKRSKSCSPIM